MKKGLYVLLVATFIFSCREESHTNIQTQKIQYKTIYPDTQHSEILKIFPAVVSFQPDSVASVLPAISGQIDAIYVKVGDYVKKGQKIVKIKATDTTDIQSNYYSVKTQLIEAKRIYELNKKLFEVGAIPKNDLIQSETNVKQLEAVLKGLEEKQRLLNIKDFTQAYIESPMDGVIYEIDSTVGSRISPDSQFPIVKIANKEKFIVVANVYEKDIPLLSKGDKVKIVTSDINREEINGEVIYISDVLDPESRTVKVYIKPEKTDKLKANAFVEVKLIKKLDNFLSIPKKAILFKNNHFYVFVENPDGSITKKEVYIVSDSSDNNYSIVKGVNPEDKLILDPINYKFGE
ncbi:MAG: efflux RND transporter periplasmic adaptor subunit [Hydrogenothermaceae bacterium]